MCINTELSATDYEGFRLFIHTACGIELGNKKQFLVVSRLNKRLRHLGMSSYKEYLTLINHPREFQERQTAIDLLTTNETYFFREPGHFRFLRERILPNLPESSLVRVWSAACSSGEEAYSVAMELAQNTRHQHWEVLATDINECVLQKAARGLYAIERIEGMPQEYLQKYCLKGVEEYAGSMLIEQHLRNRIVFQQLNLIGAMPSIGRFDVIFLRNVLIYFDSATKERVIRNVFSALKPHGYLFIGHSESIKNMNIDLKFIAPTIYQKI